MRIAILAIVQDNEPRAETASLAVARAPRLEGGSNVLLAAN
jgi:hypothetical protein